MAIESLFEETISKLFTADVNNSVYHIQNANKLITTYVVTNLQLPENISEEIFTRLVEIFGSKERFLTFKSLCKNRAATQIIIEEDTGLATPQISRALNYLRKRGLAYKAQKFKTRRAGGPHPTVWAITGYKPEDVVSAIELHLKHLTPAFAEADRIYKLILDEYIPRLDKKDLVFKELNDLVKAKSSGYDSYTLTNLVSLKLQEDGFRVWR